MPLLIQSFKYFGGTRVDVLGVGVRIEALAEDHAHQIVRAALEIPLLHLGADLVVRLRDKIVELACILHCIGRVGKLRFGPC